MADRIDFRGMVVQSKLPELYRQATMAVFPFVVTKSGVQEGFGLVVVEAMGCECPVIAGDLPALHDTVIHEENGLLFESGNSQALADAIIRALDNKDLRLKLAEKARMSVMERFDWEVIAGKYGKIYQILLH
jgi:glycosyltransferase involved in cell wall biosynthesis